MRFYFEECTLFKLRHFLFRDRNSYKRLLILRHPSSSPHITQHAIPYMVL